MESFSEDCWSLDGEPWDNSCWNTPGNIQLWDYIEMLSQTPGVGTLASIELSLVFGFLWNSDEPQDLF